MLTCTRQNSGIKTKTRGRQRESQVPRQTNPGSAFEPCSEPVRWSEMQGGGLQREGSCLIRFFERLLGMLLIGESFSATCFFRLPPQAAGPDVFDKLAGP